MRAARDAAMTLECGVDTYEEPGATVTDECDEGVQVVIGGDTGLARTLAGGNEANLATLNDGSLIVTASSTDAGGYTGTVNSTITKDTLAPAVTSSLPSTAGPTNAASLTFTVTFGEPVGNVHAEDFHLAKTGTADGAIVSVAKDTGTSFTVTVSDVTGDGTLSLDLKSGTDVQDAAGNAAEASSGGIAVTLDHTPPAAPAIAGL